MSKAMLCLIALAVFMSGSLFAQAPRTERIHFEVEANSASVPGSISGYEYVNYIIEVGTGEIVSVVLESDNLGNYFNIFEPGKIPGEDDAIFVGATEGNRFEGALTDAGDYIVQVYIIRSAARRGEVARYTLTVSRIDGGEQ